ncbi:uncharacterized protein STEHIDRAFT_114132 [Stereum hirsutum FP-91666 SS1]|uniref:uncharacterized protein n=1 Tax=Stereum hirsutum (strain FP-91666) TaxID=721885 RepID=UPI0004449A62|nr:uncharacterized protein STEHIDRAFT_114132 [Stereum hirsutum FP-91666 SS1]EIM83116.1 hypothetical protein STEHIDRAFT_114132 [Stereum hirsutum FP-91666 SS1]
MFTTRSPAKFIIRHQNEGYTENRIAHEAEDVFLGFDRVPIYHKIKFCLRDPHGCELAQDILDVAHCCPLHTPPPPREVVEYGAGNSVRDYLFLLASIQYLLMLVLMGILVPKVCAVFWIPDRVLNELFPATHPPRHLAYVEWFKPFTLPNSNHCMYKLKRVLQNGVRSAGIIPVASIRRTVHLFPQFGPHFPDG